MTTRIRIVADQVSGPTGRLLAGMSADGLLQASVYQAPVDAEFWVHSGIHVFAREAAQQDLDDRNGIVVSPNQSSERVALGRLVKAATAYLDYISSTQTIVDPTGGYPPLQHELNEAVAVAEGHLPPKKE